ncbi:hypothetical protein KY319_05080, partial [Candidatus Woesearchaeota archaeon]|nr:hypothetical protein [Candidatus Woesearchaeota archaeon]
MKTFEELQDAKKTRADKLYNIVSNLPALIHSNQEFVDKFLKNLPDHLEYMIKQIEQQIQLCRKDDQCIALLGEELTEIRELKEHAEQVETSIEAGGELQFDNIKAVKILNKIRARKDFFKKIK